MNKFLLKFTEKILLKSMSYFLMKRHVPKDTRNVPPDRNITLTKEEYNYLKDKKGVDITKEGKKVHPSS